jgi:uncharacterized protein YqeY
VSLADSLNDDMKAALKAGDKLRLSSLRMAIAAIKRQEIDSQQKLDDLGVVSVLEKLIKQGRDASEQYGAAGRQEQVDKEAAEIAIYQSYLPVQLNEAEVAALISSVIDSTGASSPKDMGRVMAAIKTQAAGQVDMGQISSLIRARLGNG